jgi:predicted transcriptional regulator
MAITNRGERLLSERRSDVRIMVEILNIALGGAKKTEIVYKVNLNFTQVRKYLGFLSDKGLIAVNALFDGRGKYKTTERGKTFLRRYRETVELIS